MNVIDCTKLESVKARLRKATSITAIARLLREGRPLEQQVQQGLAEVNRAAHGWTYLLPPPLA